MRFKTVIVRTIALTVIGQCLLSIPLAAQEQSSRLNQVDENRRAGSNDSADATEFRVAGITSLNQIRFDPSYGIRSSDYSGSLLEPRGIGFNNRGVYATFNKEKATDLADQLNIYHQPLIQIKLRIIEIVREDNLNAKTILDYLRDHSAKQRITGHNINSDRIRTTSSTRFPNPALAGSTSTSTSLAGIDLGATGRNGGIVNLTANHMNLIGEFLATEFKADLVTCPQVVTLNGQRVHLLSGANVPFELGQSVIQNGTLAVQKTFYKHVGTNLIITPRIINWGPRGEGLGQRPITVQDVKNWNAVAGMMTFENMFTDDQEKAEFASYVGTEQLMTVEHQRKLLNALNRHDRVGISSMLTARALSVPNYRFPIEELFYPLDCERVDESGCPCDWKPSDCTLDIEVILRQSGASSNAKITDLASSNTRTQILPDPTRNIININEEEVGAAISDVVQLKSGHGAVLAGLIGEREIQAVAKVPVLGDIPWLGAAFRSKTTNRQKTEIVIFLETEILPSQAVEQVPVASRDFALTNNYLHQQMLNNPLECAMRRAGFGSYLPPRSPHEKVYWERLGRKILRSSTDARDTVR